MTGRKLTKILAAISALTISLISGCGSEPNKQQSAPTATLRPSASFGSAEQRRAAKALSLGADPSSGRKSPYEEAMECSVALENLSDKGKGAFSDAQIAALGSLIKKLDRDAILLGGSAGKSEAEVRADKAKVLDANAPGSLGRIAIRCIRQATQT